MGQKFRYKPGQIVPGTDLKVVRPIASGGMGCVYEVEETSVEAPFVMKVLHGHLLLDSANHMAERMRQEAKTQARLNHKNIVRVYRAGVTRESPPLPYYVMDPLSGYSLRHVLRWHRSKGLVLPLSWAFWIASSLLAALEHAHQHGVIHRDVKPDNIFIHHPEGRRPLVKLIDFGIMAAAVSEMPNDVRLTGRGGFAGTYTHAAPEQLQGTAATPSMDLYAAGVVFYEMFAGRHPFEECGSLEALAQAHLLQAPPPISQRRDVHPKLEALILGMLAKDPKGRPESARETVNALTRIKTEWMQQTSDASLSDAAEFHFDIGERWPTNIDAEDDFSLESEGAAGKRAPISSSKRRREGHAHDPARPHAIEVPSTSEPSRASVPSRATWGNTIDGARDRSAKTRVRLTLVGGSVVTLVGICYAVWRTSLAHGTAEAVPSVPSSHLPGARPPAASVAIPTPPPKPVRELLPPSGAEEEVSTGGGLARSASVPTVKAPTAVGTDGRVAKRASAPAKLAPQRQSSLADVPASAATQAPLTEDPMRP